ncbi:MAG: DUF503 domain-containing protein [Candidatus Zixiibacteriota bacterium]
MKIRLEMPDVTSLKDKRRRLKSMMARLRNQFNISIAEVSDNDRHRVATIGASIVSNETKYGHQVLAQVVNKIEANPEVILGEYSTETY